MEDLIGGAGTVIQPGSPIDDAARHRVRLLQLQLAADAVNKNPPTPGQIAAMVLFTLSVFGLLLFLWVSFGGTLPLRPEGYRFKADFPEAALLAKEADVRMAGVNVGKVKATELGPGGRTTRRRDRAGRAASRRSGPTRARSCARRACWARPTWS